MTDSKLAQRAAYGTAILFVVRLATFFIPAVRDATTTSAPLVAEVNALLGIAPHLLLFPVVAALPAPGWARAAGWGWLSIDIATDIMQLNGAPTPIYLGLKYGGHISAALWIATAAGQMGGAGRWTGWLLGLDLAAYSFLNPFVPVLPLLPSLVLLPLWFWLAGSQIVQSGSRPSVVIDVSGPPGAR